MEEDRGLLTKGDVQQKTITVTGQEMTKKNKGQNVAPNKRTQKKGKGGRMRTTCHAVIEWKGRGWRDRRT